MYNHWIFAISWPLICQAVPVHLQANCLSDWPEIGWMKSLQETQAWWAWLRLMNFCNTLLNSSCDFPLLWLNLPQGTGIYSCVILNWIIGSDNGLSPGRHQAIIRTNASQGTNLSENENKIANFHSRRYTWICTWYYRWGTSFVCIWNLLGQTT